MKNTIPLRLLNICRVSSNEQSEGYSLESQNQVNHEWAKRKGYVIVDTIEYVETASKQKERKRFQEIIARIRKDTTIDGAVFHKVDRACRNLTDLALLEALESEKNKRIFFATQEFPQNAAGRLSVGVMGVVARWYTDNLREEVNKGFRGKIEAGEYPHRPPYGYLTVKESKDSRLPTPDPEKAENVRTIFKLMATGQYSIDTLREELFQRGIYYSAKTRKWTRSHLGRMLRYPFYIGKMLWHGQIYEGKHELIVDEKVWKKVQKVLDGRTNTKSKQKRSFIYGHGLLKCADCGYNVTAETHKKKYTYYICAQRRHVDHVEKPAWVPEHKVESQIVSLLEKLVLPKDVYDWALEYLKRASKQETSDVEKELKSLKRKISDSQKTVDSILLRAAQADDSLAEGFMRLAQERQSEVTLLQHRFGQLKSGLKDEDDKPLKILELTQNLSRQYVTLKPSKKRQIANSVFSNLELNGVSLCADYRLPFAILAKNANRPVNYPQGDSNSCYRDENPAS